MTVSLGRVAWCSILRDKTIRHHQAVPTRLFLLGSSCRPVLILVAFRDSNTLSVALRPYSSERYIDVLA